MATNLYFQNYTNSNEQTLLEDLVIEAIKMYGSDCFYLPRTMTNCDTLLTEDAQSSYTSSYMIELYLKNVNGFGGDRNIMSKFAGVEIRDTVIFSMARRRFAEEIGMETGFTRPREGDILFFPMNKRIFQIKYVENFETMYQLGALQTYEITCETFEYSNEKFNTGIPEIDILQKKFSTNALDYALRDENGIVLLTEGGAIITNENFVIDKIDPIAQNEVFDKDVTDLDLIDWTEKDPFSLNQIGNR